MASKKDLAESQSFSRRRLLTAFVSGAPGGRELEPTKPMRAVVSGVALTVMVVLGSLAFGAISPGLPDGWDQNKIVLAKDTGSRYVTLGGVLYPVLNVASARLLIPAATKDPYLVVGEDKLADVKRGETVGIVGAPDTLPAKDRLISTGWLACTASGGAIATVLSADSPAVRRATATAETSTTSTDPGQGLLVENAGNHYLITGGRQYKYPDGLYDATRRAIQPENPQPVKVSGLWLNLFPPGNDLTFGMPDTGKQVPADVAGAVPRGAVVGSVLSVSGGGFKKYVVNGAGQLAELTPFADGLYRLDKGKRSADIPVSPAEINQMATASAPAAPRNWPTVNPVPSPVGESSCAVLSAGSGVEPRVHLTFSPDVSVPATSAVRIDPSRGALVRATSGPGSDGPVQLIDGTGTAFPVPHASSEILGRLGYSARLVTRVPQKWLYLFRSGPALTVKGARAPQVPAGS